MTRTHLFTSPTTNYGLLSSFLNTHCWNLPQTDKWSFLLPLNFSTYSRLLQFFFTRDTPSVLLLERQATRDLWHAQETCQRKTAASQKASKEDHHLITDLGSVRVRKEMENQTLQITSSKAKNTRSPLPLLGEKRALIFEPFVFILFQRTREMQSLGFFNPPFLKGRRWN